jgi:hypothetical protein
VRGGAVGADPESMGIEPLLDEALTFGMKARCNRVAGVLGAIMGSWRRTASRFNLNQSARSLVVGGVGWNPDHVYLRAVRRQFGQANLPRIVRCRPWAVDPGHFRDAERRCRRGRALRAL